MSSHQPLGMIVLVPWRLRKATKRKSMSTKGSVAKKLYLVQVNMTCVPWESVDSKMTFCQVWRLNKFRIMVRLINSLHKFNLILSFKRLFRIWYINSYFGVSFQIERRWQPSLTDISDDWNLTSKSFDKLGVLNTYQKIQITSIENFFIVSKKLLLIRKLP